VTDFVACRPLASPNSFRTSFADLWTAEECDRILDALVESGWAAIDQHRDGVATRSAELQRPDFVGLEDLSERVVHGFEAVNEALYHYDLTGLDAADPPHAVRYHSGHGHYRSHMDCTGDHPLRKLSMVVLLSDPADFSGGHLDVVGWGPQPLERGRAIFVPSYFWHQVHPVTAGIRVSFVGWCHGPSFR
jgi:predicted 2-oxoglutarate/Fe(II)-dependent dioxygenase YbiX